MIQSRIHIKVQAVILVLDDFTGKPVDSKLIRLGIPGGTRVIPKPGGCFAIIDYPSRLMEFDISSPIYDTVHICEDLEAFEESCPMISVRLIPGRRYPIPEGITSLEGYAAPTETLMAVCIEQARPMRLLFDYDRKKDRESIKIYHMPGEVLEGRRFALVSGKTVPECMEISKKEQEEGLYRLKTPLTKNYKKTEISICRISRGKSTDNGYFRIPLANVPAEGCMCICMAESDMDTPRWIGSIRCGIRNIIENQGGR